MPFNFITESTNMTTRAQLLVAFLVFALLSGCGDGKHAQVTVYFPEAKTSGALPNLVTKFAFTKYGVPTEPNKALEFADKLQKYVFGGIGIDGTFVLESEFLRFDPGLGTSLIAENFTELKIPYTAVTSVSEKKGPLLSTFVVLETTGGSLNFTVAPFNLIANNSSISEDELVKKIRGKITDGGAQPKPQQKQDTAPSKASIAPFK